MSAEPPRRSRSTEAFFGRRRGKTVRPVQRQALDETLPRLLLDLDRPAPSDPRTLFEATVEAVRLEIGFGGGEMLASGLARDPATGFIGVEPFVNGMAKFVSTLDPIPGNLRLYDDDATRILDWLPEASIDRVDLFYPDPWPKRRHWKRRFVNPLNLDRIARVLKPGQSFRFASDIDHYVNWTLRHLLAHPAFRWRAEGPADWREPFPDWQRTRYEAKAIREGRRGAYLTFVRV